MDVVIWSIVWTPCSYEQTSNLLAIPSFSFVVSLVLTPDFCDKELKTFPQIVDMSESRAMISGICQMKPYSQTRDLPWTILRKTSCGWSYKNDL
jgi:hypothetical protein